MPIGKSRAYENMQTAQDLYSSLEHTLHSTNSKQKCMQCLVHIFLAEAHPNYIRCKL